MRGAASGEAVLRVRVVSEDGRSADIEAVIDTGFDGHLLLPPSLVNSLSLPRIGSARPTLADGRVVPMMVHVARIVWHAGERPVRVLVAEGGALVGMSLLRGSRLRVDVVPGGEVVVEELD